MKLEITKIVGTSTEQGWSQTHTFIPEEPEKLKKRGQLLAVIRLSGLKEEIEMVTFGRELISRIHEEYYGQLEERPFYQLKKAVEKVWIEAAREVSVEIVAGSLVDNALFVAIGGKGRVILQRNGEIFTILEGGWMAGVGGEDQSTVRTASGYLQEGDMFVMGTAGFFEALSEGAIKAALETGSADEAAEILTSMIHGGSESGLAAAILAKSKEERCNEEREVITVSEVVEEKKQGKVKELARRLVERVKRFIQSLFSLRSNISWRLEGLQRRTVGAYPAKGWGAVYSREKIEHSKKTLFTVGVVLLLLLGISLIFGNKQRVHLAKEKRVKVLIEEIRNKKTEGEAIVEFNRVGAKEILFKAQDLIHQLEGEKVSSKEFSELKDEVEKLLAIVVREHEVSPKMLFDLELIKEGASSGDTSFSEGKLIALDKRNSAIYFLGTEDGKSGIIGGKSLSNVYQIAVGGSKVFVAARDGIFELVGSGLSERKQNLVVKADKEWSEPADFQIFGGSFYLLEKTGIWQYPATEGGFETKRNWLKQETDLSTGVSMVIDGSVWIGQSEGTILKFTRGLKDKFNISGLDKPFSAEIALYTDADLKNLYVLDKTNSRIVVLDKSGKYDSQYHLEGVKAASGLAVSEKEKKIFVFEGGKIYEIETK